MENNKQNWDFRITNQNSTNYTQLSHMEIVLTLIVHPDNELMLMKEMKREKPVS